MNEQPDSVKKLRKFTDQTISLHGEMERHLYSMEVECPHSSQIMNAILPDCTEPCRFRNGTRYCPLPTLRRMLGAHKP